MMLGGEDTVVSNEAARTLYERVQIKDKAIVEYDELDHMLVHDAEYLPKINK